LAFSTKWQVFLILRLDGVEHKSLQINIKWFLVTSDFIETNHPKPAPVTIWVSTAQYMVCLVAHDGDAVDCDMLIW